MRAEWHNTDTFRPVPIHGTGGIVGRFRRRRLWTYTAHHDRPTYLRIYEDDGIAFRDWMPAREFTTDYGSVPFCFQWCSRLNDSLYPKSYTLHDAACAFGWLWTRLPFEPGRGFMLPWSKLGVSRSAADELLRFAVIAEGAGAVNAAVIYAGVRLAAPFMRHPTGGWGTKAGQGL